jgi:hypothetical protein
MIDVMHAHTATAAERIEMLQNGESDGDEGQDYRKVRHHMEIQVVPVPIARGVQSLFVWHREHAAVGNVVVGMVGNGACDDSDAVETGVEVERLKCQMHD